MAPKKKHQKLTGYMLFAKELKDQGKYRTLQEACEAADVIWSKMSTVKRKAYKDRAKQMNGEHSSRLTSNGLKVNDLLKEEEEKVSAELKEKDHIYNIVTSSYNKGELQNQEFFLIHVNTFCYYPPLDKHYPAEIAVLKFTLKDGVLPKNIFHFYVDSGVLPPGYKFDAKVLSDQTHLLPICFENTVPDNQETVYMSLKKFFQKQTKNNQFPILYTREKEVDMIRQVLHTWSEDYDCSELNLRVYSLPTLYYTLRNITSSVYRLSVIERELEKDIYSYKSEIACRFHKVTSKPQFCSQSIVTRTAYVICEGCCPLLGIESVPTRHCPQTPDGRTNMLPLQH